MHWIKRTLKLASIDPWYLVRGYPNGPRQSSRAVKRARAYLEYVGILPLLISGDGRELPPDFPDLAFLHRAVSRRKPRCILEFGCGFSTIVMASALSGGELYAVDSSQQWIENTRAKLGAMPNVHVSYSPVRLGRSMVNFAASTNAYLTWCRISFFSTALIRLWSRLE